MRDPEAPPGNYAALGMPVAAHPGPAAVTAVVIQRRSGPWVPACGLFRCAHKMHFRYGMDVGFSLIGPGPRGGPGQLKTTKPHFPPKLYISPDSATGGMLATSVARTFSDDHQPAVEDRRHAQLQLCRPKMVISCMQKTHRDCNKFSCLSVLDKYDAAM